MDLEMINRKLKGNINVYMDRNYKKGFTLIELLVVIAIIGILSAVVLASLNTARQRGADAAIKSSINNARAQAALFYEDNGNSYNDGTNNVCDHGIDEMIAGAEGQNSTVACYSTATAWAVSASLMSSDNHYCIDSEGAAREIAAGLGENVVVCPEGV